MEIVTSEKTIPVHSVGGQEFVNREDAERHLAQLTARIRFAYYLVRSGYDMTEGRGYFHESIVGIRLNPHGGYEQNAITAYCLGVLGQPLDDFYGRPVNRWITGTARIFDEPAELDVWIEEARAQARRWSKTFEGPIVCDEFGRPMTPSS